MYAVVVLSVCYLKDVNISISTTCISFFVIELVGIIIPVDQGSAIPGTRGGFHAHQEVKYSSINFITLILRKIFLM